MFWGACLSALFKKKNCFCSMCVPLHLTSQIPKPLGLQKKQVVHNDSDLIFSKNTAATTKQMPFLNMVGWLAWLACWAGLADLV